MHHRSHLWPCVAGLLIAGAAWAGPKTTVADSDLQGVQQEQQCVLGCAEEAKARISQCLQAGGEQRQCLADGFAFQQECQQLCRSGKTCEERCEKRAQRAKRRCLAEGGTEEQCAQLARELFENCIREHCPPPPPNCESECERRALEVLHACIEEGGTQEDCAMRARMFWRLCLDENCPAPAGCHERCEQEAKATLRICLEMGGVEDECAERARQHLEQCIAAHCPPPTCEEHCAHRAAMVYRECIENGGNEDNCAAHARELYNNCVRENCPPNLPCEERCRRLAAGFKQMCLEMGGTEDDCEARAQELAQQCLADCPSPCGGIAGIPCAEGEFCLFPPGTCNVSDNMGICVAIPTACPDVWQPVCGCDGQTYGNRCEAIMAQVQIAHDGPCHPPACGGPDGTACEEGFFCNYPRGSCGEDTTVSGVCRLIPEACPLVYMPVCGCDGVTYGNECEAAMHSQSIRHEGPCENRCGGIAGLPCDKGEFCKYPPGTCGCCDIFGVCMQIPMGCPDHVDPVCGCDGVTYFNPCEAAAAGVNIAHHGPCEQQGCDFNDDCGERQFCLKQPGDCDAATPGVCAPRPQMCPEFYSPVCGCDGNTYANHCFAAGAGVSIAHQGPCEN